MIDLNTITGSVPWHYDAHWRGQWDKEDNYRILPTVSRVKSRRIVKSTGMPGVGTDAW